VHRVASLYEINCVQISRGYYVFTMSTPMSRALDSSAGWGGPGKSIAHMLRGRHHMIARGLKLSGFSVRMLLRNLIKTIAR